MGNKLMHHLVYRTDLLQVRSFNHLWSTWLWYTRLPTAKHGDGTPRCYPTDPNTQGICGGFEGQHHAWSSNAQGTGDVECNLQAHLPWSERDLHCYGSATMHATACVHQDGLCYHACAKQLGCWVERCLSLNGYRLKTIPEGVKCKSGWMQSHKQEGECPCKPCNQEICRGR